MKFWHLTSFTFCWLDIRPVFLFQGTLKTSCIYTVLVPLGRIRDIKTKGVKNIKNTEMNTEKDLKGGKGGLLSSFITCSSIILIWFLMRKCNHRRFGVNLLQILHFELILQYCDSSQRKYIYSNSRRRKVFWK